MFHMAIDLTKPFLKVFLFYNPLHMVVIDHEMGRSDNAHLPRQTRDAVHFLHVALAVKARREGLGRAEWRGRDEGIFESAPHLKWGWAMGAVIGGQALP